MKQVIKFAFLVLLIGVLFSISCKKEKSVSSVVTPPPSGPPWTNRAPKANAGPDQIFSVPPNSIFLDGHASTDPDGSIISYFWSQISGPTQSSISAPNSSTTSVSALDTGTYQFRLIVTDNSNATNEDTVAVLVNPLPPGISIIPAHLLQVGPLSIWRIAPAVATIGSKIFFAGGLSLEWYGDTADVYSRVDIYDFNTGNWSTAELSQARCGISAASDGNKVVFAGGIKVDGSFTSRVDIYDLITDSWSTAELSQARASSAAAANGNKIFFAGGTYPSVSDRVDIYDVAANSWSTGMLSQARNSIIAAAAGNEVLFAGGNYGINNSNRVDIYNTMTNMWSTASLSEAKAISAATTVGNTILFSGCTTGYCFNHVDKYNAISRTWSIDSLSQFDFLNPYPHEFAGAATTGNLAVFVPSGIRNFIVYNTNAGTWALTPGLLPFTLGQSAFIAANNQIYMAGWDGVWRLQF